MAWTGINTFLMYFLHIDPTIQESTQETPFYLLYGRDPRLPTSLDMDVDPPHEQMNLCAYTIDTTERLQEAWQSAQSSIQQAQARQKW